ncbi:MAG: 50S ribosomal protein L21 [Candidatus Gottesmanbacteria bacterium GW2011_GWC2_39_8]|uniref:Large ribosomal subunit protein bL21 n=1 Tax=Candidatus Gottesmanbacteria bacterium GW2011_GWC2_39_8 TaxID=1618450 RepID=A0A0G0SIC6_9BACT|nr:MAG: 50S ribosomal protein L21 [Candidatus Gottesmanbacteria bacterium GW2011_GWC2_39_8]
MYTIVKIAGKQYKTSAGDEIIVDKLDGEKGKVEFTDVLLVSDGDKVIVGTPNVSDVKVIGEIVEQIKGDKVRVAKYKAKVRYRRVTGFRPMLTKVKITGISGVEGETKKEIKSKPLKAKKTEKSKVTKV